MQRRLLADEQLQVPQSDRSAPTDRALAPLSPTLLSVFQPGRGPSDNDADKETENVQHDDDAPPEPPPSYEQSLSASRVAALSTGSSSYNPFLRNSHASRAPLEDLQRSDQVFAPRLAPRHIPSAPPMTLPNTTSGRPELNAPDMNSDRARHASDDQFTSASSASSSARRGKRPVRSRRQEPTTDDQADLFEAQSIISSSYTHASTSSSSTAPGLLSRQQGHSDSQSASDYDLRTARRLEHKQAFARHAASAPELHPQHPHPPSTALPAPIIPLSQSVIPAPPPRLLQFRSRDPSAVPACPFLLCQKPIAFTKTRRERGVTVWIVCGLLFLCNTYWTTQALIAHFSSPDQGRVLSEETFAVTSAASSRFTARNEASHLVKGFLGFKTHRYKDQTFKNHQRHLSGLKRPTIATVGVVQDEQSALRMIVSFAIMALMAIIRWWLCLSPLLVRPLFDTVHSCPHPHPYPFPEELELERKRVEAEETMALPEQQQQIDQQQHQGETQLSESYFGDEKKRLRAQVEAVGHSAPEYSARRSSKDQDRRLDDESRSREGIESNSGQNFEKRNRSAHLTDELSPTSASASASESVATAPAPTQSRFRFFRRVRAIRREGQEQGRQAITATITQIKKKKLSWRTRRVLKKAEQRRQEIIKASQDIGRYSLLYELGSFFMMNQWKQTVLAPGKFLPEAYED